MSRPDAQIIVWDPATGDTIETADLIARPVVSDDGERIALTLERRGLQDFTYGGVKFCIEISPSAMRADPLTAEIVRLAEEQKVPVG